MGVIFIFLLVSVICSAIREGIEAILKTRAAYLENGIRKLLHDDSATGLAKSFYEHPLVQGCFPAATNLTALPMPITLPAAATYPRTSRPRALRSL